MVDGWIFVITLIHMQLSKYILSEPGPNYPASFTLPMHLFLMNVYSLTQLKCQVNLLEYKRSRHLGLCIGYVPAGAVSDHRPKSRGFDSRNVLTHNKKIFYKAVSFAYEVIRLT